MTFSTAVRSRLQAVSFLFQKDADPVFIARQASNAVEVDRYDPRAHALNVRIALLAKNDRA
jgi:hypothetical protein